MSDNKLRTLIFAAVTVVIILSGWLCDDAYHGFVMAKHLVEGNGFVYNIGERVNASTCPLFTLIIAGIYALFGRGMYIIGIGTCVIFSVLCVYMLLYKTCRTRGDLIFITLILCSKSFISYSTSGLENSLLFALGMLFFLVMFKSESYSGGELFILSFLAGLIALTRMDNILIYLPFLIYCFIVRKNKIGRLPAFFIGFAGVLPFIAWEIFSLFYYGFLFPNTAYIKLGTMISLRLYIRKGIEYVIASFAMDPAVIIIPVAYIFIALLMCRDIRHKLLSLGTALYIIYVIRIGGDFMSGRHFTVIYILSSAAVVMILRENIIKFDIKRASKILVVCMMYAVTIGNLLGVNTRLYTFFTAGGDERNIYFNKTSLFWNSLELLSGRKAKYHNFWREDELIEGLRQKKYFGDVIGLATGITVFENSDIYLTDSYGLGDPLLSHIPSERILKGSSFLIGHITRIIPEGYRESLQTNSNKIVNPSLHKYYDVIRLITRGDLFSRERIQAIIDINLGRYDYLVAQYVQDTEGK